MIPEFDDRGNLPPGRYASSIDEVLQRFGGSKSLQRSKIAKNFRLFYGFIKYHVTGVYVDGGFITNKLSPKDVDLIVLLKEDFDVSSQAGIILARYLANSKGQGLHIFPKKPKRDKEEIDKLLDWFMHDRENHQKGIIFIEVNND